MRLGFLAGFSSPEEGGYGDSGDGGGLEGGEFRGSAAAGRVAEDGFGRGEGAVGV
jgi:hypothetical protein